MHKDIKMEKDDGKGFETSELKNYIENLGLGKFNGNTENVKGKSNNIVAKRTKNPKKKAGQIKGKTTNVKNSKKSSGNSQDECNFLTSNAEVNTNALPKAFSHINLPKDLLIMPDGNWHSALSNDPPGSVDDKYEHMKILKDYATILLNNEVSMYSKKNVNAKSRENSWIYTAASTGTTRDRVTAMSYMFKQSPVHNLKYFEMLINMASKKQKRESIQGIEAVKELLVSDVLPDHRKLCTFSQHPLKEVFLSLQKESSDVGWSTEYCQQRLVMWIFEDHFKQLISMFVTSVKEVCHFPDDDLKLKAMELVLKLLQSKPEQEKNLLEMIVNKIGDPIRKISSKAVDILQRLILKHPMMQGIVIMAVRDLLLIPSLAKRSQYYCICFLTSQILSNDRKDVAVLLIGIYMKYFKSLSKFDGVDEGYNKMVFALLTGVKRAFPYANMDDEAITSEIQDLFRAGHSPKLSTAIQALAILSQMYQPPRDVPDRYYNALYSLLFHPELPTVTNRHTMFLNLLIRSLKRDPSEKRVTAFVKRVVQISSMHSSAFIAAMLTMVAELVRSRPRLAKRLLHSKRPAKEKWTPEDDDDEDEHFIDAPDEEEESKSKLNGSRQPASSWVHKKDLKQDERERSEYDPLARCPQYCGIDHATMWEMYALTKHFHPSVALYARTILTPDSEEEPFKGDPLMDYTVSKFLDRFVYRNPKSKKAQSAEQADITKYYELHSRERFNKPRHFEPVNSSEFLKKKSYDPEEVFYKKYFSLPAVQKRLSNKSKKKLSKTIEDVSDEEFDRIIREEEGEKKIKFSDHISSRKIGVSRRAAKDDEEDSDDSIDFNVDDDEDDDEAGSGGENDTSKSAGFFIDDQDPRKRKLKTKKSLSAKKIKKADDQMDRILSETANYEFDTTVSSAIVNKDKISAKQLRWERKLELKEILEKKRMRVKRSKTGSGKSTSKNPKAKKLLKKGKVVKNKKFK